MKHTKTVKLKELTFYFIKDLFYFSQLAYKI